MFTPSTVTELHQREDLELPNFVSFDPEIFDDFQVLAHHEAAHAVFAYYYGFQIGRFRTFQIPDDIITGAFQNRPNTQYEADDFVESSTAKVRQLIAGELAGRLKAGIALDQLVLPMKYAERVNQHTQFAHVYNNIQMNQPRDAAKIIATIHAMNIQNWWNWFWEQHAETLKILNRLWNVVQNIAQVFQQALSIPNRCIGLSWLKLIQWGPAILRPKYWPIGTSVVTSRYIFARIRNAKTPLHNEAYQPRKI